MQLAFTRGRRPTNHACRVASLESILGFIGAVLLLLQMPDHFLTFIVALAAVLLVTGHGLPLDERDLAIRHRALLISYQILGYIIFAAVLGVIEAGVLFDRAGVDGHKWLRIHELTSELLVLLIPLIALLPNWALPWLEHASAFVEEEPEFDRSEASWQGSRPTSGRRYPKWIRIAGSPWLVWIVAAILMLWVYEAHVPGGLWRLLH